MSEPNWKPAKGTVVLEREKARATRKAQRRAAVDEAKARDGYLCRWPERHKCRGLLEGAHIIDSSLKGPDEPWNIVSLCAWVHRRGPESIHGKQLKVQMETTEGANGPLSFWRQTGEVDQLGQPVYYCIKREGERD